MRAIFISYRRDDTEGHARTLFQDLVKEFGEHAVFVDVAGIAPGRDFRKVIDEHTSSCCVLLAMIGKNWTSATGDSGAPRLADPLDFVRLETASALKRDIPVIPVLVHGAHMPKAEQLPADLKELVFRNNVELTHARWDSDVQVLIHSLRPIVEAANVEDSTPAARPASASAPIPPPDPAASVRSGPAVMPAAAFQAPANAAKRGIAWSVAAALVVAVVGGGGYIAFENRRRAQADAARKIEAQRQAQADRTAEEARRVGQAASAAEAARKAGEVRAAEAVRVATEARAAEDARKVAEARAAEDATRAREAKATRAERQAGAQRAAEEARAAEDARKARDDAESLQKQRDAQAADAARHARSANVLAIAAEEQRRAQLAHASGDLHQRLRLARGPAGRPGLRGATSAYQYSRRELDGRIPSRARWRRVRARHVSPGLRVAGCVLRRPGLRATGRPQPRSRRQRYRSEALDALTR